MERTLGLVKVKSSSQRIVWWEIGKTSGPFSFTAGEW